MGPKLCTIMGTIGERMEISHEDVKIREDRSYLGAASARNKINQDIVFKMMNLKVYICILDTQVLAYGCF